MHIVDVMRIRHIMHIMHIMLIMYIMLIMHIVHIVHILLIMHIIHIMHYIHIVNIVLIMHIDYLTLFFRYLQQAPDVFPYSNSRGNIMKTEKNHSIKHAPEWHCEVGRQHQHELWSTRDGAQRLGQEARCKDKSRSSCCSIHGTAHSSKGSQCVVVWSSSRCIFKILCIFYIVLNIVHIEIFSIFSILCILYILRIFHCILKTLLLPARIDDKDPKFYEDDWFVLDKRLGEQVPVRADRWYQSVRPPGIKSGRFELRPDNLWYCKLLLLFFYKVPNRQLHQTVWLCFHFHTGEIQLF